MTTTDLTLHRQARAAGQTSGQTSGPATRPPASRTGTGLSSAAHSESFSDVDRRFGADRPVVDFSFPTNSCFPTDGMFDALAGDLRTLLKHYPSDSATTTRKLAAVLGLHPQTVAMASGSTELITRIDHLLVTESLAVPVPTFGRWTDQPLETGKRVDMHPLSEADGFALDVDDDVRFIRERGSRVAVVCQPNNPDGGCLHRERVVRMLDELRDLDLVVVDESFIDFVDAEPECSVAAEAAIRSNVIVLTSLGKNFGLHGVRFGYMVANPALTARIAQALPKWNLNSLAEAVVGMLDDNRAEYAHSLRLASRDRAHMVAALGEVPGLTVFPTSTNFVLVKLPQDWSGPDLRDHLVTEHGVYIRECGNKLGITSQFVRLVVRPAMTSPDCSTACTTTPPPSARSVDAAAHHGCPDERHAAQQPNGQRSQRDPAAAARLAAGGGGPDAVPRRHRLGLGSAEQELQWYAELTDDARTQLLGNLMLLGPAAVASVLLWPRLGRQPDLVRAALAAGATIEALQWLLPLGRVVSPVDAVLNAVGAAAAGWSVAQASAVVRRRRGESGGVRGGG